MENGQNLNKLAYRFIILFGVISALGDITYEGARSVTGPYPSYAGSKCCCNRAGKWGWGVFGYALRIASGYWVDRTESYWAITYIGYVLLLAVLLLAFAGHWQLVALFFLRARGKRHSKFWKRYHAIFRYKTSG